ncbi:hypothetical protein P154DRAFT_266715 [Amniculicola lignicola CBS 123094]|uniref:Uncharacterized protein n=1 Tax=Amniculicola lignicola CBS 123094 TaxID=1392246 RepID=A0A6A5W8I7_9PLEO|nr:hypothetical protein P154DRAFT_266715 [Amniculicola lignicola CBS 123094]
MTSRCFPSHPTPNLAMQLPIPLSIPQSHSSRPASAPTVAPADPAFSLSTTPPHHPITHPHPNAPSSYINTVANLAKGNYLVSNHYPNLPVGSSQAENHVSWDGVRWAWREVSGERKGSIWL